MLDAILLRLTVEQAALVQVAISADKAFLGPRPSAFDREQVRRLEEVTSEIELSLRLSKESRRISRDPTVRALMNDWEGMRDYADICTGGEHECADLDALTDMIFARLRG